MTEPWLYYADEETQAEWDAWIAEHDRQVKAEAWAEGWKANSFLDPSDYGIANPYLNGDNK